MKAYITFLFLNFLAISNGQELKIGKAQKMTAFTVPVPLIVTPDYAVSVLLTKPFSLPLLNGFSSVKQIEFSYLDNFYLVKYNLHDFSEKKKRFSLKNKRSFKAFCSTNKSLIVISHHKETKDNSLNYFIDVYDFETLENNVKDKKIIKFIDGNRRKIVYFKENNNGFDVIFKNKLLLDGNYVLEHFILNKDYKVVSYKKIPINSVSSKWQYNQSIKTDNSINTFLTDNINYKNEMGFYNMAGILTIRKDSFEFKKYILPNNMLNIGVSYINNSNEINPINLLKNYSNNDYSVYIYNNNLKENRIIDLPSSFKQAVEKVFYLSLQNVIYTFKSLGNGVFSIETKIISYSNSMGSYNSSEKTIYGPALVFKIDEYDDLSWSYLINKHKNHKLNSELIFISLNSNLYVFYSIQKAFVCRHIDFNSGLIQNVDLGVISPENVSLTSIYKDLNDNLLNLFYVRMRLKTQEPYHSPTIHPVLLN